MKVPLAGPPGTYSTPGSLANVRPARVPWAVTLPGAAQGDGAVPERWRGLRLARRPHRRPGGRATVWPIVTFVLAAVALVLYGLRIIFPL